MSGPKSVPDKALTASSTWSGDPSADYSAKDGRLYGPRCWHAANDHLKPGQWIQVIIYHE